MRSTQMKNRGGNKMAMKTRAPVRWIGAVLGGLLALAGPLMGPIQGGESLAPLASVLSSGTAQAAPLQLGLQNVTLKGGLKAGLIERKTLPLVTLQLTFKAGSAADPKGKEGLANFMAESLRAGAGVRDAKALAEALDALGAELDIRLNRDALNIRLEVLSRDLPQAVQLLSDLVLRPSFKAEELERIRRQIQAELQDRLDNPADAVQAAFYEQLYRGHAYGHSEQGTSSALTTLNREDVVRFHQGVFRPENAYFAAVGDFKSKELMGLMDKAFGDWAKTLKGTTALKTVVPPAPEPIAGRKVVLVHRPGLTQAQIRIGNIAFTAADPGETERTVANTALGGGFTSRLVEEIRVNRSLSYGANSRFMGMVAKGPFIVSTFTKNETLGETIQVALDTVKTLKEKGLPQQEFEKARAYAAGQFAQGIQTPEALAAALARLQIFGLPLEHLTGSADRLKAMPMSQLKPALDQIPYENLLILVYADKAGVLEQLKKHGEVCVVEKIEFGAPCVP